MCTAQQLPHFCDQEIFRLEWWKSDCRFAEMENGCAAPLQWFCRVTRHLAPTLSVPCHSEIAAEESYCHWRLRRSTITNCSQLNIDVLFDFACTFEVDKTEDCQNCYVLYCVTIVRSHMHTDMSSSYRWTVLASGFVFLPVPLYLC